MRCDSSARRADPVTTNCVNPCGHTGVAAKINDWPLAIDSAQFIKATGTGLIMNTVI